jgi:hypothetical protein
VVEIVIAVLLSVRSAVGISVSPSIEIVSPDLITKVSDPVTVNCAWARAAENTSKKLSIVFFMGALDVGFR